MPNRSAARGPEIIWESSPPLCGSRELSALTVAIGVDSRKTRVRIRTRF